MKRYQVILPVRRYYAFEVEADSRKEAYAAAKAQVKEHGLEAATEHATDATRRSCKRLPTQPQEAPEVG